MALRCKVVTPDNALFEGDAEHVVCPAWDGELAIYSKHAPLIARLGHGVLRITPTAGAPVVRVALYGGFLKVQDDEVTILAGGGEKAPEPAKATADLETARKNVEAKRPPKASPGEFEQALEQERRARARVAAAQA